MSKPHEINLINLNIKLNLDNDIPMSAREKIYKLISYIADETSHEMSGEVKNDVEVEG